MLDDRLTEQRNPRSRDLDRLSAQELVALIQAEDRTVAEAVAAEADAIARGVGLVASTLAEGGRLFYVGAGTSGRLGVLDAAEMPPTFGTDPDLVQGIIAGGFEALVRAREGAEDRPEDGARDLEARGVRRGDFVMGIAASGTTPYVHGALARARELGARTGFLLCTPPAPALRELHDVVIAPLTGPELVTGSTRMKAGTATKLVLNTLTTGAMVLSGKTWGNLMVDLQVTCDKLQDRGERILRATLGVEVAEARRLLDAAGGHVKTALVMGHLGVSRDEAESEIARAGGRVAGIAGIEGGAADSGSSGDAAP
ncbi:N-acetylmuramic acid 6-phosphate etherase [soil metagenome]